MDENDHWQENHCPNRAQRRAKHKAKVAQTRREIRTKVRRARLAKKYA